MDSFKFIDSKEASEKINSESPIIVDIRDKESFDRGHIDGALNLSNENIDKFVLDTDKSKSVIVCCYHGNSSKRAAQFLIDNGFYEYLQDNDISNLQDIVNSYTTNIDIINSTNNTYLDETTAKMILGYSLISILSDIIDYCDILPSGNNVTIITNILLDIILNIIQDYNDKRWINSIDLESINLNLSKQKEREKQNLLTKLDQMDKDERFAKVQLQTVGATNWFRMGEKEGAEYLDSHAYTDELEFERNKHLENVYNSPNEIINDIYTDTPDNSNNPIDNLQQDVDDGYNNINNSNYDDSEEHDSHEY